MKRITDKFEVTVGQDWRSHNLFAVNEVRLGLLEDFQKRNQPIDITKVDTKVLRAIDYGSIEDWAFNKLKLEPHKRYQLKVTVEIVSEVKKTPVSH